MAKTKILAGLIIGLLLGFVIGTSIGPEDFPVLATCYDRMPPMAKRQQLTLLLTS